MSPQAVASQAGRQKVQNSGGERLGLFDIGQMRRDDLDQAALLDRVRQPAPISDEVDGSRAPAVTNVGAESGTQSGLLETLMGGVVQMYEDWGWPLTARPDSPA